MLSSLIALPRQFLYYYRYYRSLVGRHIHLLGLLNILMSYAEGLGIALFFPLLRGDSGDDALSSSLSSLFHRLHIPMTPMGALPFIVGAFVLKGLLTLTTFSYQGHLAAQIPLRLRRDIIARLRRLDYRTLSTTNTGFVTNVLVTESARVSSGFVIFARTFPPALNIVVFFGMVMWLDWQLTVVCGLMGVCAAIVMRFTGRLSVQASMVSVKEGALLSSLLIQMVQAFKYLRATAGFGSFEQRIAGSSERLAHAESRNGVATAVSVSVSQPLMVMFLAAILYYRNAVRHEPLGSLFVLLLYFFRIMNELWILQNFWQSFVGYFGPIGMVRGAIEDFAKNEERLGNKPYSTLQRGISLRGVSFHYLEERPILRQLDLEIPRNASVAFVGESGSGKSTLVDVVMGTLKPTEGSVAVDGVPLSEMDLETLRPRVGYVPQDAMLFDDTVANNISQWKPASDDKIREAAKRAQCLDFIEAMPEKLQSQVGDRGLKLSGGQKQRIAIARELFKQPDILVLDEATSALDTESERAVQATIDALKGQMTILIIAHRLSTIRNCDHICVLHEGRIVEEGSYDELVGRRGSRFARMIELQKLGVEAAG